MGTPECYEGSTYSDEEFEGGAEAQEISDSECFFTDILSSEQVEVSGLELKNFMLEFQSKLQSYMGNPFVKVFKSGLDSKKIRSLNKYILGCAICKHHGLDVKRFIEAQFYFHDRWKGIAPTIGYVTSVHSSWNSVGRYRDYCKMFEPQIDYFGDGQDNVSECFRPRKARTKNMPIPKRLRTIYDDMIKFQMGNTGKTKTEVLMAIAAPGSSYLPKKYLEEIPEYKQLKKEYWKIK